MKNLQDNSSLLIIGGIFIVAVVGIFFLAANSQEPESDGQVKNLQDWSKGSTSDTAPVVITEYSDFECPACGSVFPVLEEVVAAYPEEVTFIYKHYPISSSHEHALPAAEAAEAAGAQGKFWEMHALIFENQNNLSKNLYIQFARDLGLDIDRFEREIKNGTYRADVFADRDEGDNLGVTGTPTIYINGELFRPSQFTFDQFALKIDSILAEEAAEETTQTDNINDD